MSAPRELDKDKFHPLEVYVDGSSREDLEYALKKFKKIFNAEGILRTLKEKSEFEKPSDKKRRKIREAKNRVFLADLKEKMIKSGALDARQKKKAEKSIRKEERNSGNLNVQYK